MYDDYDNSGFLFKMKSRLSKSEYLPEEDIRDIPNGKGNEDNLFIFCDRCSEYMDFHDGDVSMTGKWVCPKCGKRIREQTPYNQLCRDNEKYYTNYGFDEDDDDDFDYL